ncbi:ECF transporter S component [Romboutsia maritimum]|uniref:ECF transporter S component n=1 Tax=Romboutsia maritimum TaxID=2020948 RepID=A0A371IR82_9FIRM|nr:ECF transporter S component [Romboutsia maritimum]RDY22988.1 ECF transporter S component [Romboutsia maritimum]
MMETQTSSRKNVNVRRITIIAILSAISIMLSMVPFLGYIQIGPIAITTMYIPVIIGAIIEGPVVGMVVGFIFGATSLLRALTMPTITSFPFINPLVSILPRVLIGILAYYSYRLAIKVTKNVYVSGLVAGAIGAITNTIGVLGMLYVLYGERYAKALGESASAAKKLIFTIAATNGIPEAVGGALVVSAVAVILKKSKN